MADVRTVTVDFGSCNPGKERVFVTFGSFAYEITGREADKCLFRFGGEVEDPNWGEKLTTKCEVPVNLGRKEFATTDFGVNFSPIIEYCGTKPVNGTNGAMPWLIVAAAILLTGFGLLGYLAFLKIKVRQPV